MRSTGWRLTEWFPWNHTNDCPVWTNESVALRELYDHRDDTALYDIDDFENENVAADPANLPVLETLSAVIRGGFGEGCP